MPVAPRRTGALPSDCRPLVASTDEALLDDLLGLLAAAGATAELTTGGPALRRAARDAPLVLVGADLLRSAPVRTLPRRPGVLVVTGSEPAPEVWAAAVELGAERVVVLPRDEAWLLERAAAAVRAPARPGWLAVVGGACGGAGASTLATALAVAARAAGVGEVLLVDGDGRAAGLDLLLGAEHAPGLRWPELSGLSGRVSGAALVAALPEAHGVAVLSASRDQPQPVPADALLAVARGSRDSGLGVVVDLPAHGEAAEEVLAAADLAVLVVPARIRAAAAARPLLASPAGAWSAAVLVSRPVPGGLSRADVAHLVGRPVFAELAADRAAVVRSERGEPPAVGARAPLGLVSRQLLGRLPGRAA
ncbi:secretion/DNA translocation related CpaE-like protein [Modestobacter roseus]|uniref:Secretion/DNA translocation related CpaE-like protein n=1 Tax=Modestobacter roseus TaxID=1181884 RepID=A0A562IXF9_9ACTN|nr:septum site-determining protein Ssd [Modestobacter roseus]TWH75572.1 secretion/DNA translocation related CpaE-like protein [Modestobacter roseus]